LTEKEHGNPNKNTQPRFLSYVWILLVGVVLAVAVVLAPFGDEVIKLVLGSIILWAAVLLYVTLYSLRIKRGDKTKMNRAILGVLIALSVVSFVSVFVVEFTIPHPMHDQCQGCWVEHGMGTWEQIEHYNLMMSISLSSLGLFCGTALIILYKEGCFKDE